MKIIPAIDIKGGKAVRLAQGDFNKEIVYFNSPVEAAEKWASYGVELIHLVDLDGALEGKLKNMNVVKRIARAVKSGLELGGGIRDIDSIKMVLDAGVEKVVIGTKALDKGFIDEAVKKYKDNIVIGLDARDGMVCTKGWITKTEIASADLAKALEGYGISTINYTDISRDGMLEGPNIDSLKKMLDATTMNIVASGGISSIKDIEKLISIKSERLVGAIIGKALYEKKIDLKEAMEVCRG